MLDHIKENNLIFKHQYGFIDKSDTTSATVDLVTELYKNMDNHFITSGVFLDMTKAFDLVPHDFLIYKLQCFGFKDKALKILESYLQDRKQCVKIGDNVSDFRTIRTGVPQGSIYLFIQMHIC